VIKRFSQLKLGKRRTRDYKSRRGFKQIRYLEQATVSRLDKLRDDLQESIERTVRIQQAFAKQLRKEALTSNRVKHIIRALEEVPFHAEVQRKIVDTTISEILVSKEKQE
jgi:RNAse (barnase) inhibitor barstar